MDIDRLCIHTVTTKPLGLEEALTLYSQAGIPGVTLWRNSIQKLGISETKDKMQSASMKAVSLCRGGFFASNSEDQRRQAVRENLTLISEASKIGAPLVVLVPGADPLQSMELNRKHIREGIEAILPSAADLGVRLGIEPLHPMYAGDRSAINTLKQANDLCEQINSAWLGVVVDVYHLWWDPDLQEEIERCGDHGNIFAFHVSDWKVPTIDLLNDRGLMGEGCIPIRQIREWVDGAGFQGMVEVEIFSDRYWQMDQEIFVRKIVESFERFV